MCISPLRGDALASRVNPTTKTADGTRNKQQPQPDVGTRQVSFDEDGSKSSSDDDDSDDDIAAVDDEDDDSLLDGLDLEDLDDILKEDGAVDPSSTLATTNTTTAATTAPKEDSPGIQIPEKKKIKKQHLKQCISGGKSRYKKNKPGSRSPLSIVSLIWPTWIQPTESSLVNTRVVMACLMKPRCWRHSVVFCSFYVFCRYLEGTLYYSMKMLMIGDSMNVAMNQLWGELILRLASYTLLYSRPISIELFYFPTSSPLFFFSFSAVT